MFGGGLKRNAAELIGCEEEEILAIDRVRSGGQNHALVATDSTLHQLRMPWPGLTKVKEEVARYPLEGLVLEIDKWDMRFLRNGEEVTAFRTLQNNFPRKIHQFFKDRDALVVGEKGL